MPTLCCPFLFTTLTNGPQGRQEDLRSVVDSLRATFGVDYIYCWHGLPAYWSGISLEVRRNSLLARYSLDDSRNAGSVLPDAVS